MKAVRQREAAASSACRRPPLILHEFDRARHPRVDRMVGGFEGEHEQALLIGVDAIGARFVIVDDAQVRRIEACLRDGAHRPRGGEEIGEAEHGVGAEARPPLQAHPRFGDDAKRAFRADHHAVGARARARARQAARFHDARGRDRAQAFDQIVDMRVEGGEMAARAGGDPAAERRELEALRIVAQGEAMRFQRRFDRGAADAGLNARGAAGRRPLRAHGSTAAGRG